MPFLLKLLIDIAFMKKGPQDLPWSHRLLHICLLVYVLVDIGSMLTVFTFDQAVLVMLSDVGVLLIYTWFCLWGFGKLSRFVQTMTALAGIGVLFQLLLWPLLTSVSGQGEVIDSGGVIIFILVEGWYLAVYAHIFREAFNVRMLSAFVITLCYVAIAFSVNQFIIPEAGV